MDHHQQLLFAALFSTECLEFPVLTMTAEVRQEAQRGENNFRNSVISDSAATDATSLHNRQFTQSAKSRKFPLSSLVARTRDTSHQCHTQFVGALDVAT